MNRGFVDLISTPQSNRPLQYRYPFSGRVLILGLVVILATPGLAACQVNELAAPAPATLLAPPTSISSLPTFTLAAATATLPEPTATLTLFPSATPTITQTPDPYADYRIASLRSRSYGGGEIESLEVMAETPAFTRYLIRYPSDGLQIYGFLNVPKIDGPLPVVIAIHGYIEPDIYNTIDYTTRYADELARNGFLVIHPNLRGYPPSDEGDNLFRVGMAIDVLNLIGIVEQQAGIDGLLEKADGSLIGLWGHSMGGGISTRVMTVSQSIDAVLLYAPMTGDELRNYTAINEWSFSVRGEEELAVPEAELLTISPKYFYNDIPVQLPISIHHGRQDDLVPLSWSRETCEALIGLEKNVQCLYYDNQGHTFSGEGDLEFMLNAAFFFRQSFASVQGGTP